MALLQMLRQTRFPVLSSSQVRICESDAAAGSTQQMKTTMIMITTNERHLHRPKFRRFGLAARQLIRDNVLMEAARTLHWRQR